MAAPVFIGDEVSAAGFRLAGVRIRTPQAHELKKVLEWACHHTPMIMITSEYAAMLDSADFERFATQASPAFVVLPDIRAKRTVEDLNTRLRIQLGIVE